MQCKKTNASHDANEKWQKCLRIKRICMQWCTWTSGCNDAKCWNGDENVAKWWEQCGDKSFALFWEVHDVVRSSKASDGGAQQQMQVEQVVQQLQQHCAAQHSLVVQHLTILQNTFTMQLQMIKCTAYYCYIWQRTNDSTSPATGTKTAMCAPSCSMQLWSAILMVHIVWWKL